MKGGKGIRSYRTGVPPSSPLPTAYTTTGYEAGGTPLAVKQEDFLVAGSFKSQLIDNFRDNIVSWEKPLQFYAN